MKTLLTDEHCPKGAVVSMINIRHLRAFTTVAEHQHFTHAAEAIHVSQPALSALIQQLEQDLGVTLLDRNTRNVELTEIGREFYDIAQKALTSFDDALSHIADYGRLRRGRVTIAALPSVAASVLPSLLLDFIDHHPRIDVSILDLPGDDVIEAVRTKRADIGLTHTQPDPDLVNDLIMSDRLVLVGQLRHAKPKDMRLRWKQLGNEPIIAMTRGTTIRALVDAAAASAKTTLNIVIEPRLLPTAIALAEQRLGSAILPSTIMPIASLKKCQEYELTAPAMTRDISVVRLADSPLSPAARAMHEKIVVSLTKQKVDSLKRRRRPAR